MSLFFWPFGREYSDAAFIRCDVTSWDDQVSMFERALSRYGSVDVVVGFFTTPGGVEISGSN